MGLQRNNSDHRKGSSFDIRNFSFMKSSETKSRRHIDGKPPLTATAGVNAAEQTRFRPHHQQALSVHRSKRESGRRTENPPSSSCLRDSRDGRRHRRSSSVPEVSAPGELSTSWRKITKWPAQKLCSSASKVDCVPKKSLPPPAPPKNERVQPKYVDKSCSPILQLVARKNMVVADPPAGKMLQTIEEQRYPSNDQRVMLPKIEESVTASSSPSSSQIPADDEATRSSTIKCKNCGSVLTPPGMNEIVEQALVENECCKKHPPAAYLIDPAADTARSLIHVPAPIVDVIRTQIVPAMQNNANLEDVSRIRLESAAVVDSSNLLRRASLLPTNDHPKWSTRRQFPFGKLRKNVSPINPKNGIYPPSSPPVPPPRYNWVSPLPHTPGFRSPRRGTTSPRQPSPVITSPSAAPSNACPPLEVESKAVVPARTTHVTNKCIEWYKKIVQGETTTQSAEREERRGANKCEEWCEKIASEDRGGGRARENAKDFESNAQKFSRSRTMERKADRETPTAFTSRKSDDTKLRYPSSRKSSTVISSPQRGTKFIEERVKLESRSSEIQFPQAEKERPRSPSPIEKRRTQKSVTAAQEISSPQPTPVASTAITIPTRVPVPLTTKFPTPINISPAIEVVEGGGTIITDQVSQQQHQRHTSTTSSQPEPASAGELQFTSERWGRENSRGDPRRRTSFFGEGRLVASEMPVALTTAIPSGEWRRRSRFGDTTAMRPVARLRKITPTKVIPQSYRRVNMRRDTRNQIRMYKAKCGMAQNPLNPFFWFRKNNQKPHAQQVLMTRTALPFVNAVLGSKPLRTVLSYSGPRWSSRSSISPPSPHPPPPIMPTCAAKNTNVGAGLEPTTAIVKLEDGGSVGDLICAKPKLKSNAFKSLVNERAAATTTRAQMFRSQFIQKKIRLVNNHRDSWWKNFNSQSLPTVEEGRGVKAPPFSKSFQSLD